MPPCSSSRPATEDKVHGLTIGGDDYVTKPFSLEELGGEDPDRAATRAGSTRGRSASGSRTSR
jgi:DNA-binding response OmpR family regulator